MPKTNEGYPKFEIDPRPVRREVLTVGDGGEEYDIVCDVMYAEDELPAELEEVLQIVRVIDGEVIEPESALGQRLIAQADALAKEVCTPEENEADERYREELAEREAEADGIRQEIQDIANQP